MLDSWIAVSSCCYNKKYYSKKSTWVAINVQLDTELKEKMDKMLEEYGYEYKPMELVLFNDALEHVTKIHRIIRFPKGSALLVGFGGSGK